MTPPRLIVLMAALAFVMLGLAFLTGCSALGPIGISFETDFGRFSYHPAEIPAFKDK